MFASVRHRWYRVGVFVRKRSRGLVNLRKSKAKNLKERKKLEEKSQKLVRRSLKKRRKKPRKSAKL
jgi:hypothetical protein